jgi:hypothetical protein
MTYCVWTGSGITSAHPPEPNQKMLCLGHRISPVVSRRGIGEACVAIQRNVVTPQCIVGGRVSILIFGCPYKCGQGDIISLCACQYYTVPFR